MNACKLYTEIVIMNMANAMEAADATSNYPEISFQ